jgi:hypothetical protein
MQNHTTSQYARKLIAKHDNKVDKLAEQFIEWKASTNAQRLWQFGQEQAALLYDEAKPPKSGLPPRGRTRPFKRRSYLWVDTGDGVFRKWRKPK